MIRINLRNQVLTIKQRDRKRANKYYVQMDGQLKTKVAAFLEEIKLEHAYSFEINFETL